MTIFNRYEIQVSYVDSPRWRTFHSGRVKPTLRGARDELAVWREMIWDFAGDKPVFRIYDRKMSKAVE